MAQVNEQGSALPLPEGPDRRRTGRLLRRRLARTSAVSASAGLLLVWPAPVLAPGVACGPVDADTAVITLGSLAGDGELGAVEQRIVRGDGEVCVAEADVVEPTVAVGILHTDAEGRSREVAELDRIEGRLTTRIEARDVTASTREVSVQGPLGADTVQRRLGLPQLVRIALSYPSNWDVEAPDGDGITTTVVDGVVEVSRTAVLFPPLLDDAVALEVRATPARGTPSVTVEASPLAGAEPFVLPGDVFEQDALAVIGALSAVGEDGAVQLADGADELAGGVGDLAGGAGELAGGAGELAGGLSGLSGGAGELAGGLSGLSGGVGELAGGAVEVAGGAAELADGTRELEGGVAASAQGSGEVAAGARELQQGSSELAAAAGELATGADELAAGARALADGLAGTGEVPTPELDVDAVIAGLETVATGIAAVRDDLADLVEPEPEPDDPLVIAVATLTVLADTITVLAQDLGTGLAVIEAALEGLEAAAEGAAGLAEGAGELAAGSAALAAGAEDLAAGVTALAGGTTELTGGLEQLAAATGELRGGATGLATGTAGLAQGSRELADGSRELADGAGELADGSRELATGSQELADGTDELATGTAELAEGSEELADGAGELPEVLAEVTDVADRRGQDTATILAMLDAGEGLAREHVGAAALRTLQLRHEGEQPVPVAALAGTAASVLVVLLGLFGLARRRWGRG